MNTYGLGGRTAVITGGASGIGRACAHVLARSGADISIWDRDQDAIDLVLKELEAYDYRSHGVVVDVSEAASVDQAMEEVVTVLGHVSIAVCNAGIGGEALTSGEYTDEAWHHVIRVNLDGVFYTQRAAIRAMRASGRGGSIINMASILGTVGFPTASAYTAAKHGVVGLMRTLANGLAPLSIRVNTVHPTAVNTMMAVNPVMTEFLENYPGGGPHLQNPMPVEMLEPEDISAAIAYLVSDEAKYVTGVTFPVDAGFCNKL